MKRDEERRGGPRLLPPLPPLPLPPLSLHIPTPLFVSAVPCLGCPCVPGPGTRAQEKAALFGKTEVGKGPRSLQKKSGVDRSQAPLDTGEDLTWGMTP